MRIILSGNVCVVSEIGFLFQNARRTRKRRELVLQPSRAHYKGGGLRAREGAAARGRVHQLTMRPLHLLPGRHQFSGGRTLQPCPEPNHQLRRCLIQRQQKRTRGRVLERCAMTSMHRSNCGITLRDIFLD